MSNALLQIKNLSKTYPDGTQALKQINLDFKTGEFVAIIGLSGAGKSTLLRCINRLVEPNRGSVVQLGGHNIVQANGRQLRQIRRQIGMVFQHYNLIKRSTTVQNVLHGRLGYMSSLRGGLGMFRKQDVEMALAILERVGLSEQAFKRADELSGGQQQRVGIARAIAQQPAMMMADEPIASLDPSSSETVMNYLRKVCKEDGITTIVNLHQVEFAMRYTDRIVGIRQGEVVFDGKADTLRPEDIRFIYGQKEQEHVEDAKLAGVL